jgi:hypothetical protein
MAPHFVARDASGHTVAERLWGEGAKLGHEGAVEHLTVFLRERLAGDRLVGLGHRVVHRGPRVRSSRARRCAELRAGDITRLEKLATELMGAVRPGTAGLENADGDVQSGGRPAGQRAYRGPVVRLADRLNR